MVSSYLTGAFVESPDEWQRLASEWDAVLNSRAVPLPFLRSSWMANWWRQWGRGHRLRIIAVRDAAGSLIAVAPFYVATQSWLKLGAKRLGLMADTYTGADYLGWIARPGFEQSVCDVIVRMLIEDGHAWDYMELDHVLDTDESLVQLRAAFVAAGYAQHSLVRSACPYAALPTTFQDFLGARGQNVRYNFRRRLKALHREGRVAFITLRHADDILRAWPELLRLHGMRFSSQAKASSFLHPDVQRFHQDTLRRMGPEDGPRLYLLEVDGRAIAALYGFSLGARFLYFQSGMDPHWARWSIGLIMMGCAIEQAIKDGHREFDFLRGNEAYKYQWASDARTTHTLRLYGPHMKARWVRAIHAARRQAGRLKRALVERGRGETLVPGEGRRAHLEDQASGEAR